MKGVQCPLCHAVTMEAQHICVVAGSVRKASMESCCGASSSGGSMLSVSFSEASDDVKYFNRMEGEVMTEIVVGERVRVNTALAGPSKQEVLPGEVGRVMRVYPCGLIEVMTDSSVSCFAEPVDLSSLGHLSVRQSVLTTVPLLLSSASLQLKMASSSPATITSIAPSGQSVSIQFESGPRCDISPTHLIPQNPEPPVELVEKKQSVTVRAKLLKYKNSLMAKIRK
eukprot:TRINITY_DN1290_c2_g1_i1.p1 TRINITY_DN1290_c2_g1~~TRINITY_DN1290_c2_g1_i1.p1  ORF type:complete len:233 (+),score=43.41 TRINITY_DN1290_c2_g1_i1:23-700(+)